MVFHSKIDSFFVKSMLLAVFIVGAVSFFPLFAEGGTQWPAVAILTSMFFIVIGLMLWMTFSIQYVFHQDYLFVKGGPFRSQIPYENITTVSPTTDIFTGYRILSSRDGVEIFYKTAILGSVKISPKDKKEFIKELRKRCPNMQIRE